MHRLVISETRTNAPLFYSIPEFSYLWYKNLQNFHVESSVGLNVMQTQTYGLI